MKSTTKALLRNAHDDKTEWNRCREHQTKHRFPKNRTLTKYFSSSGRAEYTLHLDSHVSEILGI